jgi:hypothetical protein
MAGRAGYHASVSNVSGLPRDNLRDGNHFGGIVNRRVSVMADTASALLAIGCAMLGRMIHPMDRVTGL